MPTLDQATGTVDFGQDLAPTNTPVEVPIITPLLIRPIQGLVDKVLEVGGIHPRNPTNGGGGATDDDEGGGPTAAAEPIATLRTFRTGKLLGYTKKNWESEVFFGQNLLVQTVGSTISVGDAVFAAPKPRTPSWLR